jgi:hypothetical protein
LTGKRSNPIDGRFPEDWDVLGSIGPWIPSLFTSVSVVKNKVEINVRVLIY